MGTVTSFFLTEPDVIPEYADREQTNEIDVELVPSLGDDFSDFSMNIIENYGTMQSQ